MRFNHVAALLTVVILTFSCNKTEPFVPVCDGSSPTYDADISLIIQQNCIQCHGDYSSYAGLSTVISNGQFEKEVLTDQTMPQSSPLTEAQLNKIKCWVENSYPEN